MYEVRVRVKKKLKNVTYFRLYENALAAIVEGDPNLWELADVVYDAIDFSRPQIVSTSTNEFEYGRDFRFIYPNDVDFFLAEIYPQDNKEC